ncbi:MAG: transcription antitermination factor NusB [Tannerella sp.]|jgi:N utilization substance protein B|nr:transcription antitermination factor NusB [Tannerella sp.]
MINRVLIRIKVLQVLYAYCQNGTSNPKTAENDLLFSLQKSYDLYHYLLWLIVELTRVYDRILDNRKHKYRPTEEDLHPNMRLADNRFARQLEKNEALTAYVNEYKLTWMDDEDFLKALLDRILASDTYAAYVGNPENTYAVDRAFWRDIFRHLISDDETMDEYLEDRNIFWNDDVEIVESFVLKTVRHFNEVEGEKQALLPMFKDVDDRLFAIRLLRQSIDSAPAYRERIDKHVKNWESERVALMDMLIMQLAVTELLAFPSIPVNVTLNEYIDMAKYYSTPKSSVFINGILDSVVDELKGEGLLLKP